MVRKIGINDLSKIWKISMHKCKICGTIFHYRDKRVYCPKCIPKYGGWSMGYSVALNYEFAIAERRKREKEKIRKEKCEIKK